MPYDACIIDLGKKGFSPAAAARACAIATYEKTGMKPGDPGLKGQKGSVSGRAQKIATQLSSPVNLEKFEDVFRLTSQSAFEFSLESDDPTAVDPFQPMYVDERGYSPRMLREVFLIRKGEFNGIPFNDDDLQALVDNWERPIPFQIDHKTDYGSNIGHLLSVRKAGSRVYGLSEVVGYQPISDIRSGKLKEISIGFYLKPRKLIEFSATKFPAVGGKDPARILNPEFDPKNPPRTNYYSVDIDLKDDTTSPDMPPEHIPAQLSQDQPPIIRLTDNPENNGGDPAKGKQMDSLSQQNPANGTPPAAAPVLGLSQEMIMANFQKQMDAVTAKLEAVQNENKQLKTEVTNANETLKLQRNTGIILQFASQGLMIPSAKDDELKFINGLSDEQLTNYMALKEKNGPVIPGKKVSLSDQTPPGETSNGDKEAQKARLSKMHASGGGVKKTEAAQA